MTSRKHAWGQRGRPATPIQLAEGVALRLPWWTALTSTVSTTVNGWAGVAARAVSRTALAEAERSRRLMGAGRRMGLRFWAVGGSWINPRRK